MRLKPYHLIVMACLLLAACLENADCVRDGSTQINFTFNRLSNNELDTLTFSSIIASTKPNDTIRSRNDTIKGETLTVQVDPNDTVISIAFTGPLGIEVDNVEIKYDITPRLISPDCGVEQLYTGLEVISNDFDSSAVVKSNLENESSNQQNDQINIRLYAN